VKYELVQSGIVVFSCVRSLHALLLGDRDRDSSSASGVVRFLRSSDTGSVGAGEDRLRRGGEEAHIEQAADERQTEHHPSHPEGCDGDSATEAARGQSAGGRPGGDPQL